MTTWHDNKTFVEGFDMDWKLLRILHLRVRPDVNSMIGAKMFGNLRRVAEYTQLDPGKLQQQEAGSVVEQINRVLLKIE